WLSADIPVDTSAPDGLKLFLEQKHALSDQFGLGGFDRSAAWAFRRNEITYVHYRLVHGRSALPYFLDIAIKTPDMGASGASAGLALAGTPFLSAGKTAQRAWLTIPRSSVTVEPYVGTTSTEGARISVDRNEYVVSYELADDGSLVFDSLRLRWSGFSPVSDAPAFAALIG